MKTSERTKEQSAALKRLSKATAKFRDIDFRHDLGRCSDRNYLRACVKHAKVGLEVAKALGVDCA